MADLQHAATGSSQLSLANLQSHFLSQASRPSISTESDTPTTLHDFTACSLVSHNDNLSRHQDDSISPADTFSCANLSLLVNKHATNSLLESYSAPLAVVNRNLNKLGNLQQRDKSELDLPQVIVLAEVRVHCKSQQAESSVMAPTTIAMTTQTAKKIATVAVEERTAALLDHKHSKSSKIANISAIVTKSLLNLKPVQAKQFNRAITEILSKFKLSFFPLYLFILVDSERELTSTLGEHDKCFEPPPNYLPMDCDLIINQSLLNSRGDRFGDALSILSSSVVLIALILRGSSADLDKPLIAAVSSIMKKAQGHVLPSLKKGFTPDKVNFKTGYITFNVKINKKFDHVDFAD
ncbi:unnamed protein product [Protopolystoma xenopodis]|uniref:Uncharacterized protein n=1 Tax=Protopolystoma xenopodis TaxID=117903 RepID=A0A448XM21_9PLAT|nr:unnamed protein product [Protopolystoma xenopodis]